MSTKKNDNKIGLLITPGKNCDKTVWRILSDLGQKKSRNRKTLIFKSNFVTNRIHKNNNDNILISYVVDDLLCSLICLTSLL